MHFGFHFRDKKPNQRSEQGDEDKEAAQELGEFQLHALTTIQLLVEDAKLVVVAFRRTVLPLEFAIDPPVCDRRRTTAK